MLSTISGASLGIGLFAGGARLYLTVHWLAGVALPLGAVLALCFGLGLTFLVRSHHASRRSILLVAPGVWAGSWLVLAEVPGAMPDFGWSAVDLATMLALAATAGVLLLATIVLDIAIPLASRRVRLTGTVS